VSVMFVIGPES